MFLKLQKKITNFVTTLDLISDKDVKKRKSKAIEVSLSLELYTKTDNIGSCGATVAEEHILHITLHLLNFEYTTYSKINGNHLEDLHMSSVQKALGSY